MKRDTSADLIDALRNYFATFGVPELLSTDGASIFTSHTFRDFCERWGIEQRISSSYHPRSNKRAELAVKHAKQLVQDSLGPGGDLHTDFMARALLSHRNTPDSVTGLSPAQVIFGCVLRDFLPASPGRYAPQNGDCMQNKGKFLTLDDTLRIKKLYRLDRVLFLLFKLATMCQFRINKGIIPADGQRLVELLMSYHMIHT